MEPAMAMDGAANNLVAARERAEYVAETVTELNMTPLEIGYMVVSMSFYEAAVHVRRAAELSSRQTLVLAQALDDLFADTVLLSKAAT
jgi:hypothetical protein